MKQFTFFSLFVLILLIYNTVYSQDTLWTLAGEKILITGFEYSTDSSMIQYNEVSGKHRRSYTFQLFSLHQRDGQETVFYQPEPTEPTIGQMRSLVNGHYAARQKRLPLATSSGFVVGAVAPFSVLGFYSPVIPVAYSVGLGSVKTDNHKFIQRHNLQQRDGFFILGYADGLRKKRTVNSLVAGGIGFIVSLTVIFVTSNNK